MSDRPRLTKNAIRAWADERSFERGEEYHHSGDIFDPRREGDTLRARCHGSSGGPYRVEATLDGKGGILTGRCSCPVGVGCKHLVALLLGWCERPETFKEAKDLREWLKFRSKGELIKLIEQMLRRKPELEDLLDMPLPKKGKQPEVKVQDFKKRADRVYARSSGEWGASEEVAEELEALNTTGDDFLKAGNPAAASAVYEGVCRSVLEHDGMLHDEPGHLGSVIVACSEGLGQCLEAEGLPRDRREPIFRVLFDTWFLDAEHGGTGVGDTADELLLEHTTGSERERVVEWVCQASKGAGEWAKRCCGGMLLALTEDRLDDEKYLALCREYGLRHALLERLLKLGRIDEAEAEAAGASDYDLLQLADLMVTHRHGKRAEQLIKERSQSSNDRRLLEWLHERAKGRKDRPAMLEMSAQLFRASPCLEGYRRVRELAGTPEEWKELAPSLVEPLRAASYSRVLVEILLEEGDLAGALKAVQHEGPAYGWDEPMRLKVAAACEEDRPRDALAIYQSAALSLIRQRGRESYSAACKHLKKVRGLYERLGEKPAWDKLIGDIREKNRRLWGLQEELNRAKL
jgi:hypothetical protein